MPDFNNFVYFVLVRNSNASYSFTGYTDKASGDTKVLYMGKKDHKGNDVPHRFRFDRSHRSLRIPKNWRDINKNSVVEFLRDFPECGDSPNGVYTTLEDGTLHQSNMYFKEMNEGKDAQIALDAKGLKNDAETLALKTLQGDELAEMAILCGTLSTDEKIQRHRVAEYAGASPEPFLEMYNQPERKAKALLRKAVTAGIVSTRGTIHSWENITLGSNEDMAVAKLAEDSSIREAIEQNMTAVGV